MYSYRKLNDAQKRDAIAYRKLLRRPLHAPPHFADGLLTYLLTGAIFEHKPIMQAGTRRSEFERKLIDAASHADDAEVFAWCILPNHWHLLARVDLETFGKAISRLHNGTSTQWNREDESPGRKVWHRFTDRRIRSESHFWAAVNYLHANPVRHEYAAQAEEWPTSSIHFYLNELGPSHMQRLASEFPLLDFGKGWDW
jgi:putative transposase